ncbi:MAG: SIMPL domain-containing protein [Caldisericota bacterium]|nr:SIMPL domain-containing protein [Caldisericota bacterium]
MSKKFIAVFILTVLVLSTVVIGGSTLPKGSVAAESISVDEYHLISVTGTGTMQVTPDIAYVSFGIQSENENAGIAMEKMSSQANAIIDALKEREIKEKDIKTTGLSLVPIYRWDKETGKSILDHFRASEFFKVKCTINNAGAILTCAGENGANIINGVSFDISNREELKLEAIKKAMDNAKAQAEISLNGTRYMITGIKTISIGSISNQIRSIDMALEGKGENLEIPIEGGMLTIQATVQVIYTFD